MLLRAFHLPSQFEHLRLEHQVNGFMGCDCHIESFFKLLKRAGQHVEQWQQETADSIAKRLLVAAQACVIVWALMQSTEAAADELKEFLIRLSRRLMKRGVNCTAPALLAGMWNLLAIIDALDRYSLDYIQPMATLLLQTLGLDDDFDNVKELVWKLMARASLPALAPRGANRNLRLHSSLRLAHVIILADARERAEDARAPVASLMNES